MRVVFFWLFHLAFSGAVDLSRKTRVHKISKNHFQTLKHKGESLCSKYGHNLLWGKFGTERHLLCLKIKAIGASTLTSHRSALILDPDSDDDMNIIQAPPLASMTMAFGFPVEDPSAGSAEGYIGDDHQFYGVLHLRNRTLHADPYGKDDLTKYYGAFENDNVLTVPRMRRHFAQPMKMLLDHTYFPYHIEDRQSMFGTARARICDLLLLADKAFFEKDANSSLNHVVRRMMHAVAQADIIFRNTDFNEDGTPDNIGFSVKYILVLTSNETNTRVFGNLMGSGTKSVDGREYLMKFARLRRLSEVCLGVAFSGNSFHNRTLGLSFTSLGGGMGGAAGGLCDRRAYGRSFNTLAIAHTTTEIKDRVPERIAALTLAHEMGHSFGAHHDDNFPNPECRGYLMGSQSSTAENVKNFEFSKCSKRLITTTLSSMSYCLAEDDRPYCGNGIVEEGEACDCGLPSYCSQMDPCCTPRAGGALIFDEGALHKEGCSVAPKAICHPSQGLCCTPNCEYADLSNSGIECQDQDRGCSCTHDSAECFCGLGGRCLRDGSCHALECALLGLRECQCLKKQNGTLRTAHLCGVCCLASRRGASPRCMGIEQAAYEVSSRDPSLLDSLTYTDNFYGPNKTLSICARNVCKQIVIRAWGRGEVCVTRGAVGLCSLQGVCTRVLHTPRSNVYPDIMNVKLQKASSSESHSLNLYFSSIALAIVTFVL